MANIIWTTHLPAAPDVKLVDQATVTAGVDTLMASQINTVRDIADYCAKQIGSDLLETDTLRKREGDLEALKNNIVDWTVNTHLNYWTTVTQPQLLAKRALGTLPQSAGTYAHGVSAVSGAYTGGVLAPNGRIYLVPLTQAPQTNWHYIDTVTGTVVAYAHGVSAVSAAYTGGVLAPNGRIYLVPYAQAPQTNWHYIDTNSNGSWHKNLCTNPMFNKF